MYESYFRNLDSFHLLRVLGEQISTKNWILESLLWSMGKENQTCHCGPIVPWLRGPKKQWLRATHMARGPYSWRQERSRGLRQRPRKEGVQSQDNFLQQKRCPFHSGFFFFFFWPWSTVCRIFAPWPGIEPMHSASWMNSLNDWTAREVPLRLFYSLKGEGI